MANRPTLILDPPSVLKFRGPFNITQTSELKLQNPSDSTKLFKIKTTYPKRYCVKPNSGFVAPESSTSVSIMLQPSNSDSDDRSKHKFMVQSLAVPADVSPENYDDLWKEVLPGQVAETRLKCAFVEADECDEDGLCVSANGVDLMTSSVYLGAMSDTDGSENQRLRKQVARLNEECARLRKLRSPSSGTGAVTGEYESSGITLSGKALFWFTFIAFLFGVIMGKRLCESGAQVL